jgi:hypothetical protein
MNRTEAKQLIESPILKAFIEGKKIERICGGEWIDRSEEIDADHLARNLDTYRIKPEPREFWARIYPQEGLKGALYIERSQAEKYNQAGHEIIKVREVI